ncbi:ABC transporter permease subunit, partial [Candidatus Bathyarchaeota archaeon]|nr:ABC transporter permease subunit [Candidatus Bathyarchaeota archaeon]
MMQDSSQETSVTDDEIEPRSVLPWQDSKIQFRYKLRKLRDRLIIGATLLAVIVILYPLLDILFMFFYNGALAISIPRLTGLTLQYGLANSIVGTLLLIAISTTIAVPLGILGGIYLAEFSEKGKWNRAYADAVRFISDVLSGMPSILLGYVGFLILVIDFGWGLSSMAGGVILAILMLPYVIKTTELSIRKVPLKLREAASALGATKSQTIN